MKVNHLFVVSLFGIIGATQVVTGCKKSSPLVLNHENSKTKPVLQKVNPRLNDVFEVGTLSQIIDEVIDSHLSHESFDGFSQEGLTGLKNKVRTALSNTFDELDFEQLAYLLLNGANQTISPNFERFKKFVNNSVSRMLQIHDALIKDSPDDIFYDIESYFDGPGVLQVSPGVMTDPADYALCLSEMEFYRLYLDKIHNLQLEGGTTMKDFQIEETMRYRTMNETEATIKYDNMTKPEYFQEIVEDVFSTLAIKYGFGGVRDLEFEMMRMLTNKARESNHGDNMYDDWEEFYLRKLNTRLQDETYWKLFTKNLIEGDDPQLFRYFRELLDTKGIESEQIENALRSTTERKGWRYDGDPNSKTFRRVINERGVDVKPGMKIPSEYFTEFHDYIDRLRGMEIEDLGTFKIEESLNDVFKPHRIMLEI